MLIIANSYNRNFLSNFFRLWYHRHIFRNLHLSNRNNCFWFVSYVAVVLNNKVMYAKCVWKVFSKVMWNSDGVKSYFMINHDRICNGLIITLYLISVQLWELLCTFWKSFITQSTSTIGHVHCLHMAWGSMNGTYTCRKKESHTFVAH